MKRVLHIDGFHRDESYKDWKVVEVKEPSDLEKAWESYVRREGVEEERIVLDCRKLGLSGLGRLISFVDQCPNDLCLVMFDPVPDEVRSRFLDVVKKVYPRDGLFLAVKFRYLPKGLKARLFSLLKVSGSGSGDLAIKEENDSDEW